MDVRATLITEGMRRDVLLRALQKRIYFEKTVSASMAPSHAQDCSMALPSWFVREHGDKIRQPVLLWSGLSTEPWRVQLSFSPLPSCSRPEVKFCGAWRAFAAASGFVVGDSLIFCLRAMSEFEVYVFRETPGSPIQTSSILTPRKRPHDFELPKEKVNWSVERDLVAGRSGGRVISEILEQGKARARSPVNKTKQEWHRKTFFEKTLTTGAVSKAFQLTLPARFIKLYADKIRNYVVLQSVKDRKAYTVKLYIKHPDKRRRPELLQFVFDRGGWRDFVLFEGLIVGDRLRFTLVDMSKFEVVILHSGGQNSQVVRLSVQGPGIRSKDSASAPICQPATKSLGPQVHVDLTAECSMKKERESNSDLQFAEKVNSEGSDGEHSASDFSPRWTPMSLRDGIKESNVQGRSTSFNHTDFMTKAEVHK